MTADASLVMDNKQGIISALLINKLQSQNPFQSGILLFTNTTNFEIQCFHTNLSLQLHEEYEQGSDLGDAEEPHHDARPPGVEVPQVTGRHLDDASDELECQVDVDEGREEAEEGDVKDVALLLVGLGHGCELTRQLTESRSLVLNVLAKHDVIFRASYGK